MFPGCVLIRWPWSPSLRQEDLLSVSGHVLFLAMCCLQSSLDGCNLSIHVVVHGVFYFVSFARLFDFRLSLRATAHVLLGLADQCVRL